MQVKIVEASGRIGGRVKDDFSFGSCVGLGAMIINGVDNNPTTLLSQQLNRKFRFVKDKCELINEQGLLAPDVDKKVTSHYDQIYERIAEWRNTLPNQDIPLEGASL